MTKVTKDVVIDELRALYNSTSTECVRLRITKFLASVGAYGATG